MTLHRLRRNAAGAAVALLTISGLGVANAAAAAAAYPICTSTVTIRGTVTYIIPATSSGNTTCQLTVGNSGPGVSALQRALNACYGTLLVVDGSFGPKTRDGVLWAQESSGTVGRDGIYGPETRDHMQWPTSASSNPCRIL